MFRRMLPPVIALVVFGALLFSFGRQFIAPPPRQDVIEGPGGWLFPGWNKLVGADKRTTDEAVTAIVATVAKLKEAGARPFILLVPEKVRILPQHAPTAMRAEAADMRPWNEVVGALRAKGLTVIDAAPVLQAVAATGVSPFERQDAHWTSATAEEVARAAAKVIAQGPPLLGAQGDGETPGPRINVRRYPDLVEIQRHKGDNRYGEDTYILRGWTTPKMEHPAIQLFGNSFVDRQYGFPQTLSETLDRRVAHHVNFGREGPWVSMNAYLKSARIVPGEVVVWQLGEGGLTGAVIK